MFWLLQKKNLFLAWKPKKYITDKFLNKTAVIYTLFFFFVWMEMLIYVHYYRLVKIFCLRNGFG